jgi:predicted Zn-ribbon and HTH transcriptional regulator
MAKLKDLNLSGSAAVCDSCETVYVKNSVSNDRYCPKCSRELKQKSLDWGDIGHYEVER